MEIRSKRLILREIGMKDYEDIKNIVNNPSVSEYLTLETYPYQKKNVISWIKRRMKQQKEKPRNSYVFAINLKDNPKFIGSVDLIKVDRFSQTASLGCWLDEKYWKKGYAKEASNEVINFAFNKLKLRKINCYIYDKNIFSHRLAKKLGFKKEGFLKEDYKSRVTKKIHDTYLYGLFNENWKKGKNKS